MDYKILIENIRSVNDDVRRQAIINIEGVQLHNKKDKVHLIKVLKSYITQHYDSLNHEELITVSAAIRKCAVLLDMTDIDWFATLLDVDSRVPSLDAELEISKMIFRRYLQSPPECADPHPRLSERLAEIANDYLRPRVFKRDSLFLTIVMMVVQAMMIMGSKQVKTVINQINESTGEWYRELLYRRMNKVLQNMPADAPVIDELRESINCIKLSSKENND